MANAGRRVAVLMLLFATACFGADGSGDGTDEAIQAWLDLAGTVAGNTYTIGAGTFLVNTEIQMNKAVTIRGQGVGVTILTDAVAGDQSVFDVNTTSPDVWRIEQIEFGADATPVDGTRGVIDIGGTGKVAFGNLKFAAAGLKSAFNMTASAVTGVVYEVEAIQDDDFCYLRHDNWAGGTNGDGSWENAVNWGSDEFLFFEDCTLQQAFDNGGAMDGDAGLRVVVRNCTITNDMVGNHGTESSSPKRSARAMEVYNNVFNVATGSKNDPIVVRGGTVIAHGNTATNYSVGRILVTSYRGFVDFNVFGSADGTFLWDENDASDTGTGHDGGAAGDGVFEAGTVTTGGEFTLTDSAQAWTTNEWVGYTLRQAENFTSSSGGSNSVTVSGAGWTTSEWVGFVVTRTSDNAKSQVDDNTTDTLTLKGGASNWPDITYSASQAFVLSRGTVIMANTATNLTLKGQGTHRQPDSTPGETIRRAANDNYIYLIGDSYEIRRVSKMWDQSGRGISNAWVGRPAHQDLGQHVAALDPSYEWDNTHNAADMDITPSNNDYTFVSGVDYINDTQKPGYTPYTYPHPLRGIGNRYRAKVRDARSRSVLTQ